VASLAQALQSGMNLGDAFQQGSQRREVDQLSQALSGMQSGQLQSPEFARLSTIAPAPASRLGEIFGGIDDKRVKAIAGDTRQGIRLLEAGDHKGFLKLLDDREADVVTLNGKTDDVREIRDQYLSGDIQGTLATLKFAERTFIDDGFLSDPRDSQIKDAQLANLQRKESAPISAEQSSFESLIADFTPEQQKQAKMIKAGLKGRAMNNALMTAIGEGKVQSIADAKAIIKQSEKFAEATGASRAKMIDTGVEKITKINAGLANIDSAVTLLQSGAGVGAIEKFLPSFKAASVELDNVQKSMALDVIGAVTFGALSKGELDLAQEVALPTGLDTPQLIEHLNKRKSAQEKLRNYYDEQIQFLDQGGSVAGFMRSKKRGEEKAPSSNKTVSWADL